MCFEALKHAENQHVGKKRCVQQKLFLKCYNIWIKIGDSAVAIHFPLSKNMSINYFEEGERRKIYQIILG